MPENTGTPPATTPTEDKHGEVVVTPPATTPSATTTPAETPPATPAISEEQVATLKETIQRVFQIKLAVKFLKALFKKSGKLLDLQKRKKENYLPMLNNFKN